MLLVGLAHFAAVPGIVLAGDHYGWNGTPAIFGNLPLLLTWPVGCLLLAYTFLCYVRAALRPLGLPFGPHHCFPKGSHGEIFEQPELFTHLMVDEVLPATQAHVGQRTG